MRLSSFRQTASKRLSKQLTTDASQRYFSRGESKCNTLRIAGDISRRLVHTPIMAVALRPAGAGRSSAVGWLQMP